MSGSPPLPADAAVVERSHLHLHERDGKLVAFPVIPVNTLQQSNTLDYILCYKHSALNHLGFQEFSFFKRNHYHRQEKRVMTYEL